MWSVLNLNSITVSWFSVWSVNCQICLCVKILKDTDLDLRGKHVLIVEDIIDTGLTLEYVIKYFKEGKGVKSLKTCTLLSKPERRKVDVQVEYIGFEVPDKFVIGYGLDYNQKYRNLPYIAIVVFE